MAPPESDGLPEEEELLSEAEVGSDEEEERGSSVEVSEEDEDEEGSDDASPTAQQRPRKKHKPFVAPPPRALPQRTTRGARMASAAEEGDEEFWNQEFFAEEANDDRYETESEPEDRYDADFDESEQEGDEDEEAAEAEAAAKSKEPKKKVLKPPGYKKPPLPKPRPKAAGEGSGSKASGAKQRRSSAGPEDFAVERRTVRDSTRLKVEEGELERKMAEKYKPRRAPQRSSNYKPLTQAELLAEAAKTEIENTKSLEMMVAIEEESRKKAQVQKRRYAGPMVRWKSRKVGDGDMTTLEIRNMALPDEMRPQVAPPPAPRLLCAVTGQPARYRDPASGLPYASLEAFRELKRRQEAELLAAPSPVAAAATALPLGLAPQPQTAAVRQSPRQAAAQAAVAAGHLQPQQQQFVQMQQPLYQPQALLQQLLPFGVPGQEQQQQQQAMYLPQPLPLPHSAAAAMPWVP